MTFLDQDTTKQGEIDVSSVSTQAMIESPSSEPAHSRSKGVPVMRKLVRKTAFGAAAVLLFLLAAEVTARLDDWVHRDVPLLAIPNHERDLIVRDTLGIRGKPHGRYKKWKLNAFGFRGPEISQEPAVGTTRIMVLGASETFGLGESENKEFPAQLADFLRADGAQVEVINAAVAGMTVRSMTPYWELWASQFRPKVVFIYPPPLFYLVNDGLAKPRPAKGAKPASPPAGLPPASSRLADSRFLSRVKEVVPVPEFISNWRRDRAIAALTEGKSEDWFFRTVPRDRLHQFIADLAELTASIRKSGAEPIVLTHAVRVTFPPRSEDFKDLQDMRTNVPRASLEVLWTFEQETARAVRDFGREQNVRVIDAAAVLNGRRAWFIDLVHFNDDGAAALARLLADQFEESCRMTCELQ